MPLSASGGPSILGLWPYHSNLCLYFHVAFFFASSPLLSLIRTLVIGFRAHLDNTGGSHLEILTLITSAKPFPKKVPLVGS